MFHSDFAAASQPHDCGNGNTLTVYQYENSAAALPEITAWESELIRDGFAAYQINEIVGNHFATYTRGDEMVHCEYFPACGEFRVVTGPRPYLPDPVTDFESRVTPSVSIIGMTENVECLVLQLEDGSFIGIDGGFAASGPQCKKLNAGKENEREVRYYRDVEKDMETTYRFMKDRTPDGGKPRVIWMISHADPDHTNLAARFFKEYADKIRLSMIVTNFPNLYNIGLGTGTSPNDPKEMTSYGENFIASAKTNFPDVKHYIYHTGEKLYLPGCVCEFLMTAGEDMWPGVMPWMNHTSGVWRFHIQGKKVMVPGDAETGICDKLVAVFGDYLQSDVLQTNHHGANGATLPFYEHIDPTVCLWPCQQYHLDYDRRQTGTSDHYLFNRFLRNSPKVIAHLSNSETHTVLLPSLEIL